MILAVDVDYRAQGAVVAGVVFNAWTSEAPCEELTVYIDTVAAYVPGQFYRRELPCILALLERLHCHLDVIVIDGFVHLGSDHHPGLGAHLRKALGGKVAIIGVAKSNFKDTPPETELFRGNSQHPLYVTSAGVCLATAKASIACMSGPYRIPNLLKRADTLCRIA